VSLLYQYKSTNTDAEAGTKVQILTQMMFPAVFSNIPKLDGKLEPDLDLYAWDAAMRTSGMYVPELSTSRSN
jgi:hypothetical protein